MKNISLKILAITLIATFILSACGGNARIIQDPTQMGYSQVDGGETFVFSSPTLGAKYEECIKKATEADPALLITEFTGSDETVDYQKVWWCGDNQIGSDDIILMSSLAYSQFIPGRADDIVIVGTTLLYEGGKMVVRGILVLAASVAVEQTLAAGLAYLHSNKEHSPSIEGTDARRVILAFIAAMGLTQTGGSDPRNNCGEVRDAAGALIKVAYSFLDSVTGKYYTLWYWAKTPGTPWGGAYQKEPTGKGGFEEGPRDLKQGWTWTTGPDICSKLGNNVPALQAAQPSH